MSIGPSKEDFCKLNNLRITTDVAGGYCRLENMFIKGIGRFLDIRGNDAKNYINEKGKNKEDLEVSSTKSPTLEF